MTDMVQPVSLSFVDDISSEAQLFDLTDELSAVRGVAVTRPTTAAPTGSKAVDVALLALILDAGVKALPNLLNTIAEWLTRQPRGTKLRLRDGDLEFEWEGGDLPPNMQAALTKLLAKRGK
jgi:hypothetical protein